MSGVLFALIISIGIPVGFFIWAIVRKRKGAFILGSLAFISSQILFRIPIIQVIEAKSVAYTMFQAMYPIVFSIFIALSAGLVEEGARFILMRYLLKVRTWERGLFFGAGHGGTEAVLFVGIGALIVLFSQQGTLYHTEILIGGIERFFAIVLHIGLSLLVLRSVVERRFIFLVAAILLHTFVNALVGIVPIFLSEKESLIVIELVLAIVASSLFCYSLLMKRRGVFQ